MEMGIYPQEWSNTTKQINGYSIKIVISFHDFIPHTKYWISLVH
jgi:hypothetical protein